MDHEEKLTAYHEAAHAVLDTVFGFGVEYVTIIPTDEHDGVCKTKNPPKYFTFDQIQEDWAMGRLTGEEAEKLGMNLYGPDPIDLLIGGKKTVQTIFAGQIAEETVNCRGGDEIYDGSASDRKKILFIAFHGFGEEQAQKIIDTERAEAEKLVNKYWIEIEAVANALIEKKTLTGDEVEAIIKGT